MIFGVGLSTWTSIETDDVGDDGGRGCENGDDDDDRGTDFSSFGSKAEKGFDRSDSFQAVDHFVEFPVGEDLSLPVASIPVSFSAPVSLATFLASSLRRGVVGSISEPLGTFHLQRLFFGGDLDF